MPFQQFDEAGIVSKDIDRPRLDLGENAFVEVLDAETHVARLANVLTMRQLKTAVPRSDGADRMLQGQCGVRILPGHQNRSRQGGVIPCCGSTCTASSSTSANQIDGLAIAFWGRAELRLCYRRNVPVGRRLVFLCDFIVAVAI